MGIAPYDENRGVGDAAPYKKGGFIMAYEEKCVFCGERLTAFRASSVNCGGIYQNACKSCAKEVNALSMEERCRRALSLGLAKNPEALEEKLEFVIRAEEARPKCLRCGGKLKFEAPQCLDNSPLIDSLLLSEGFEILPAYCQECGKYEFYKPDIAGKNDLLSYLIQIDTEPKG